MRYFVTGFGAFDAIGDNPSATLARKMSSSLVAPFRVLRVSYSAVDEFLESSEAKGFDCLLMLGYAKRDTICPELVGRNLNGAHADVDGESRPGPIDGQGPESLNSTLWAESPFKSSSVSLPPNVKYSENAGDYLCNYILYRALRLDKWAKVGFIHVPSFDVISERDQVFSIRRLLQTH